MTTRRAAAHTHNKLIRTEIRSLRRGGEVPPVFLDLPLAPGQLLDRAGIDRLLSLAVFVQDRLELGLRYGGYLLRARGKLPVYPGFGQRRRILPYHSGRARFTLAFIPSALVQPNRVGLLLEHFAQPTLGANADFGRVDLEFVVLGDPRRRLDCRRLVADCFHLVHGFGFGNGAAGGVVLDEFHGYFTKNRRLPGFVSENLATSAEDAPAASATILRSADALALSAAMPIFRPV